MKGYGEVGLDWQNKMSMQLAQNVQKSFCLSPPTQLGQEYESDTDFLNFFRFFKRLRAQS